MLRGEAGGTSFETLSSSSGGCDSAGSSWGSEHEGNGRLVNVLHFNFLLFPPVIGGLVNLHYFFITFVCSSVAVNEPSERSVTAEIGRAHV